MTGLAENLLPNLEGSSWHEPGPAALAEAFLNEARLLTDLIDVLRQQREGVAGDNLALVDDTIYAALIPLERAARGEIA